jgi:hypothetical protein
VYGVAAALGLYRGTAAFAARFLSMMMNLLCRLFPRRCGPKNREQTTAPATGADLGQREAKREALSEEQLEHMEGGAAARAAQRQKSRVPPQ